MQLSGEQVLEVILLIEWWQKRRCQKYSRCLSSICSHLLSSEYVERHFNQDGRPSESVVRLFLLCVCDGEFSAKLSYGSYKEVFWKLVKGELRQQLMSYAEDFNVDLLHQWEQKVEQ